MAKYSKLFTPLEMTPKIKLKHRVVMAPMTRSRCAWEGLPTHLHPIYYEQRATDGGLLISEGFQPSPEGRGYIRVPNLYTKEHSDAWKDTVNAVKSKGGFIFAQLMHTGRVSHRSVSGVTPVSSSAVGLTGQTYTKNGLEDYEPPRALETSEIPRIVEEFTHSALLAIDAGFDGVEIHGGNGYLFQQFHATQVNKRTDRYGGTAENRTRLTLEVVDAIASKIGSKKLSIRLQPGFGYTQITESPEEVKDTYGYLISQLSNRDLAYLHISNFARSIAANAQKNETEVFPFDVEAFARANYRGILMINAALDSESADKKLESGVGDLASFASLFISNPDLVDRIRNNKELNMGCFNRDIWYGKSLETDAEGFIDWPTAS